MNPTASHLNKYLKDTALFQVMIVEMENQWFQLIKMFVDSMVVSGSPKRW